MQSGAVPTSLSDLTLPDPSTDQAAGVDGSPESDRLDGSPAADRFERYLASARRSVSADQPLPMMARSDRINRPPADARRDPIDRGSGPGARSDRSDRADRGPDRSTRTDRGQDRSDRADDRLDGQDRDRRDRVADRDDRADRSPRTDDTSAQRADGPGVDDRSGPTDDAAGERETEVTDQTGQEAGDATADGASDATGEASADAVGAVVVDTSVSAADLLADGTGTEGEQAAAVVEGELEAGAETDEDVVDGAAQSAATAGAGTHLTAHLEVTSAQTAVAATAVDAASAGSGEGASTSDVVDGEGIDLAQAGAALDTDAATGDPTGEGDQQSATDEATSTARGTDGDQAIDPTVDGADGPDAGPGRNQMVRTDGLGAQAQTQAATTGQAARSVDAGPTQLTAVDTAGGPGAARSRVTTATATAGTQNAAGAEGPVFDGDPADPLWLQVRRAMGSLRTLQNGDQQLTIRLRPAELGQVVVRVAAGEQGTTVSLMTDSAVAATQLGQQRQQLISELEQGGLDEVAIDITNGGAADGELADGTDGDPADGDLTGGEQQPAGDGPAGSAAAAAMAGAANATVPRAGGRGRRSIRDSSGGLLDVDL